MLEIENIYASYKLSYKSPEARFPKPNVDGSEFPIFSKD